MEKWQNLTDLPLSWARGIKPSSCWSQPTLKVLCYEKHGTRGLSNFYFDIDVLTQFIARDGVLAELAEQTGEKRQLERIAAAAAAATDAAAADANAQTSDAGTSHAVGEVAKGKKRSS